MKVLVIGCGGREHALVWKIKQNPQVKKIYCAPGNAGIARLATCENIPATDLKCLLNFAIKNKIDLTVVGPEIALVAGIVDLFEENGLAIFGPSQRAAELEGSKAFCKQLLQKYRIPTAEFKTFVDFEKAAAFVRSINGPIVVKADGLAAGKGAIVCPDVDYALSALRIMLVEHAFGNAGKKVIVEEHLEGQEISVMAIADGERLIYLAPSQDHKRIFDNDQGPNTGGMGAYAPTPFVDQSLLAQIEKQIMEPTIAGMALEDRPFKGVLYAGVMLTRQGPKILEFNTRFGDPETQAVLPLVNGDLVDAMIAARNGALGSFSWHNRSEASVCVVITSGGYPDKYQSGKPIFGLDNRLGDDIVVFHAGTAFQNDVLVTSGGRVLGVTAIGANLEQAVQRAYQAVGKIAFDGAYFRRDIAAKGLQKNNKERNGTE